MKKIAFGFPLLLAVLPHPAQANEAVANSSLHLLAQSDIQLAKERLLIERDRINADYLFVNPTAQDITVPVVFPMPPLSFSDVNEAGEDYIPGIRNIKIRVDGQIVTPQPRWTVVLNAPQEEITDKLQQAGWTVEQLIAALSDGEFSPPPDLPALPPEWFKDNQPQFTIQRNFIWQQTFPAGKAVTIHQVYTPSVSLSALMSTDELDDDNTCPTAENRLQIQQALDQLMATQGPAGNLRQNRMDVTLTGNPAWKEGDIGEFTLRLHGDVITTCFQPPLTRVNATTLEFKQKNFRPAENLAVTFYSLSSMYE
ncbi:DUF4424 domain-containing protein [Salmonella enterica subsp. enterica serovar Ituri]|nr:DUF4424 domain-containing protein [Salmonella enterica subsp. enterica serovar Ituri]